MPSIRTLNVSGSPNNVNETPSLKLSEYEYLGNDGRDVKHVSTDWIVLDSNNNVVFESLANVSNKNVISIPPNILKPSTKYEFKARFNTNGFGSSSFVSNVGTTSNLFEHEYGSSYGGGLYCGIIEDSKPYHLILSPRAYAIKNITTDAISSINNIINGYEDWDIPTQNEIDRLYSINTYFNKIDQISGVLFLQKENKTDDFYGFDAISNQVIKCDKTTMLSIRLVRRIYLN